MPVIRSILLIFLLLPNFVRANGLDKDSTKFYEEIPLGNKDGSKVFKILNSWALENYGENNYSNHNNYITTRGNFNVYSKNFFGKSSKVVFYEMNINVYENNVIVKIHNIHIGSYKRPMHKGDPGGWSYKRLKDIYPPEKKMIFEKKTYRQYFNQTYSGLQSIVNEIIEKVASS